jgi:hypothetical protein
MKLLAALAKIILKIKFSHEKKRLTPLIQQNVQITEFLKFRTGMFNLVPCSRFSKVIQSCDLAEKTFLLFFLFCPSIFPTPIPIEVLIKIPAYCWL